MMKRQVIVIEIDIPDGDDSPGVIRWIAGTDNGAGHVTAVTGHARTKTSEIRVPRPESNSPETFSVRVDGIARSLGAKILGTGELSVALAESLAAER